MSANPAQPPQSVAHALDSAPDAPSLFDLVRDDPAAALAALRGSVAAAQAAAALRDDERCTLLMIAALCAEPELVEALWPHSDLAARDKFEWTPLHHAAAGGSAPCAITLLREAPEGEVAAARAVSGTGVTPLILAAQKGHWEVLQELLPLSDPQIADFETEQGALAWAAAGGSADCVALLLADPRACQGDSLVQAMRSAASSGSGAALRVLVQSDAHWNNPTRRERVELELMELAAAEGHAQIIRTLAELAPSAERRNELLQHAAAELLGSLPDAWSEDDAARFEALDEALSVAAAGHGVRVMQDAAVDQFGDVALPKTDKVVKDRDGKRAGRGAFAAPKATASKKPGAKRGR